MFKHRLLLSSRQRSGGFTLVELMITLMVLAIALAIGVPGLRGFIVGQKVKTAAFDMASALMIARSEAIKRNTTVTLAHHTDGWAAGWTVKTTIKSETTVLSEQAASPGVTITATRADEDVTSLVFNSTGRTNNNEKTYFQISTGTHHRCITVDMTGMFATKPTVCPSSS